MIHDGVTGTLFPPDDPDALADALAALLANRGYGRTEGWRGANSLKPNGIGRPIFGVTNLFTSSW